MSTPMDHLRRRAGQRTLRPQATTRHAGRAVAGLLGAAIALSGTVVTAQAASSTATRPSAPVAASTATPQFDVSPRVWGSGARVTVTVRGMTPRQSVDMGLLGCRGNNCSYVRESVAVASRTGVVKTTITWPSAAVTQAYTHYELWTHDEFGRSVSTYFVRRNGRWVATPDQPAYKVGISANSWRSGQRVTLTVAGVAPSKRVTFSIEGIDVDAVSGLGSYQAVANRAGVATITITWPKATSQRPQYYTVDARDPRGFTATTEVRNNKGTWSVIPVSLG